MAKKLAKSAISQKRVLDAAAKIFRDFGYAGTTMRAIADEADLKAGSIYYHYESKDELISAVLDQGISAVNISVMSALEALPETVSGRERIEAAIRAHLSAIIDNGDYTLATRRVFGQVPEAIRAKNLKLRDSYGAMWLDILNDARAKGELRSGANFSLARLFIFGALNWTVEWYKPGGRTIEDVAREFTALIFDGLGAESAVAELAPEPSAHKVRGARVRAM